MKQNRLRTISTLTLISFLFAILLRIPLGRFRTTTLSGSQRALLEKCQYARTPAGPPSSYNPSSRVFRGSDRFELGTPATLIRNARILTGKVLNGTEAEVIEGDILLNKGIVVGIGYIPSLDDVLKEDLVVIDAKGKWVTPGLVDAHSHLGVNSLPKLNGTPPVLFFTNASVKKCRC